MIHRQNTPRIWRFIITFPILGDIFHCSTHIGDHSRISWIRVLVEPIFSCNSTAIQWARWWFNGLDDGKIYRKPLYLMVKTMVSCRFSLKPIHWMIHHGNRKPRECEVAVRDFPQWVNPSSQSCKWINPINKGSTRALQYTISDND